MWPEVEESILRGEIHVIIDLWPALGGVPVLIKWSTPARRQWTLNAFRGSNPMAFEQVLRVAREPADRGPTTQYRFYVSGRQVSKETQFPTSKGQRLDAIYWEDATIHQCQDTPNPLQPGSREDQASSSAERGTGANATTVPQHSTAEHLQEQGEIGGNTATPTDNGRFQSEEEALNLIQEQLEYPTTLPTWRPDTESLSNTRRRFTIPHGDNMHFESQASQIETVRQWLTGQQVTGREGMAITAFVQVHNGVITVPVFVAQDHLGSEDFAELFRRQVPSLYEPQARVFVVRPIAGFDHHALVILPVARGREIPVLFEVRYMDMYWRDIRTIVQSDTIASFMISLGFPYHVLETAECQFWLNGDEVGPFFQLPWVSGHCISIIVSPYEILGEDSDTAAPTLQTLPWFGRMGRHNPDNGGTDAVNSWSTWESSQNDADDLTSLMQMSSSLEDLRNYEPPAELVPRYAEPRNGFVQVNAAIATESDVLRSYVEAHTGGSAGRTRSVHTWLIQASGQILRAAQVCILQDDRSFTQSLILAWKEMFDLTDFAISVADPIGVTLALRSWPVDLVGLPINLLRNGQRVYLIDVLIGFVLSRVAIGVEQPELAGMLIWRLGYSELCKLRSCILSHETETGLKVWQPTHFVAEPHGAILRLEYQPDHCRTDVREGKTAGPGPARNDRRDNSQDDTVELMQRTRTASAVLARNSGHHVPFRSVAWEDFRRSVFGRHARQDRDPRMLWTRKSELDRELGMLQRTDRDFIVIKVHFFRDCEEFSTEKKIYWHVDEYSMYEDRISWRVRWELRRYFPQETLLACWYVEPQPSPYMQQGRDDLHVITQKRACSLVPQMVVSEFHPSGTALIRVKHMTYPPSRNSVIHDLAMTSMCELSTVLCWVSHNLIAWNGDEQQHVGGGKRIDADVLFRQVREATAGDTTDECSLMQGQIVISIGVADAHLANDHRVKPNIVKRIEDDILPLQEQVDVFRALLYRTWRRYDLPTDKDVAFVLFRLQRPGDHSPTEIGLTWEIAEDGEDISSQVEQTWPDVSYRRHNLMLVDGTEMLDHASADMRFLLVSRGEPRQYTNTVVVLAEICHVHSGIIWAKQAAVRMKRTSTMQEMIRSADFTYCNLVRCIVRYREQQLAPNERIRLRQGDHILIIVNEYLMGATRVQPFFGQESPRWGQQIWDSKQQRFSTKGRLLFFRWGATESDTRIGIPVEPWMVWRIVDIRLQRNWADFKTQEDKKVELHHSVQEDPLAAGSIGVYLIVKQADWAEGRLILTKITWETQPGKLHLRVERWGRTISELEVSRRFSLQEECERSGIECLFLYNGQSMRFRASQRTMHGDYLRVRVMRSACWWINHPQISPTTYQNIHAGNMTAASEIGDINYPISGSQPNDTSDDRLQAGTGEIGEIYYPISGSQQNDEQTTVGEIGEIHYPISDRQDNIDRNDMEDSSLMQRTRAETGKAARAFEQRVINGLGQNFQMMVRDSICNGEIGGSSLVMHGLAVTAEGKREIKVRQAMEVRMAIVHHQIRQAWSDFIGLQDDMGVFLIHPQPHDSHPGDIHVLVDLAPAMDGIPVVLQYMDIQEALHLLPLRVRGMQPFDYILRHHLTPNMGLRRSFYIQAERVGRFHDTWPNPGQRFDIVEERQGYPMPDEEGISLLQFQLRRQRRPMPARSVAVAYILPETNVSIKRLPPPGNPVFWLSHDFQRLDEWLLIGTNEIVVDYVMPKRRLLKISECLDSADPCLATGPRKTVSLHRALQVTEIQSNKTSAMDVKLPDVRSLINKLQAGKQLRPTPWAYLMTHIEDGLQSQLECLKAKRVGALTRYTIYTDGSYMATVGGHAGWSCVVIASHEDGDSIFGCDWGPVECDPLQEGWTGSDQQNARAGEITALVRASEWVFGSKQCVPHCFAYDAVSVGHGAAGWYGYSTSDLPMRLLRALMQALEARCRSNRTKLIYEHVQAHAGHIGNEIADLLAKKAVHEGQFDQTLRPDYMPFLTGERPIIEQLWLFFDSDNALPPIMASTIQASVSASADPQSRSLPNKFYADTAPQQTKDQTFKLACLTYNVSSLQPGRGRHFTNYLREQIHACQYGVSFLQETRARASEMVQSATHIRVVSAAVQGKGGVEIWLLSKHPSTGAVLFSKDTIRVLHAGPELLILTAGYKGIKLLLFSSHAPHTGSAPEMVEQYWDELRLQLGRWTAQFPTYIGGIDANSHFASDHPPYVGSCGLEDKENLGSKHLVRLLSQINGFLPSTFDWCHEGETATWFSNANGQLSRCDYFVVPLGWATAHLQSYMNKSIDSGTVGTDHFPLALEIVAILQGKAKARAKVGFDRTALQQAPREQLMQVFSSPPDCEWALGVDQHALAVTGWISKQLVEAFPLAKGGPKKSYITAETWELRRQRIRIRQSIVDSKINAPYLTKSAVFSAWHRGEIVCLGHLFIRGFQIVARLRSNQKRSASLSRQLGKALRSDRTKALEKIGSSAATMSQKELQAALKSWGVQSRRKPTCFSPLPIIRDADGEILENEALVAERWRAHFSEQEDGLPVTAEELVRLNNAVQREGLPVPEWTELPTLAEIEAAMRRTAPNKAFFADGVPGEVLCKAPSLMARVMFPLFLKQVLQRREALIFKGGRLVPSFKKGDASLCTNYRSLFVSSPIGKILHGIYRQILGKHFEQDRAAMQLGGLKGQTIVQVSHVLHLFHAITLQKKHSCAILFIDVQNAFYRLLRKHLVNSRQDKRGLQEMFRTLGLAEQAYEEFTTHFVDPPVLEEGGLSPFLVSLFREFFETTWYAMEGTSVLTWTRRGSRPGDSFADICFGYALKRILSKISKELQEKFPFIDVTWNNKREPHSRPDDTCHSLGPLIPVWADDVAVAISHMCPVTLMELLPQIVKAVLHGFYTFGLKPNMAKGKTELFVDLRGKGAVQARRELASQQYQIDLQSPVLAEPVHVVGHYKHLGTILQRGGSMYKDISTKFAYAHDVITKFRTQIFGNRALGLKYKTQMMKSLVLSTISYNSATWQARTQKQDKQIQKGYTKLCKRLAALHFGRQAIEWSLERTLGQLELPSIEVLLREARLRYLMQVVRFGQPHFWGLVQAEHQWFQLVKGDLEWMQSMCPSDEVPTGEPEGWPHVEWWAHQRPVAWKRLIKKAVARAVAHKIRCLEWDGWHTQIIADLIQAGILTDQRQGPADDGIYCVACVKKFASKAALAVHSFKKHSRINTARHYVQGKQCLCCLKHYTSNINLVNHVKRSDACFRHYEDQPQLIDVEPGLNSRELNKQYTTLPDPFFQAEGPRLQHGCQGPPVDPIVASAERTLQVAWDKARESFREYAPFLEALRAATSQTHLYPEEIRSFAEKWKHEVQESEIGTLDQHKAVASFLQKLSFAWLTGSGVQNELHLPARDILQTECGKMTSFDTRIHRAIRYRPAVYAHIFSGRRREGDLESAIEQLGGQAMSIDIIFHTTYGDLCRTETYDLFTRALKEDVLLGFLAGPPCESWSRARGRTLANGCPGPRRLRTVHRPMGKLDLTSREDQQVRIGNRLLGVAIRLLYTAALTGKCGILEHPAEDTEDESQPSIWKLEIIALLMRFPFCRRVRVFQGMYGAASPKPTEFLLVNITESAEALFCEGRSTPMPKASLIGTDPTGVWKTARLKEYPPDLNAVLARLLFMSQPDPVAQDPLPDWFVEWSEALKTSFDLTAGMGNDCHR